jgi:predicted DNA-binding protein
MNRKSETERKSCVISFRVTKSEKEHIETLIKHLKRTKSNWFREHYNHIINILK